MNRLIALAALAALAAVAGFALSGIFAQPASAQG